MTIPNLANRESYLNHAVDLVRPWFAEAGFEVPEVRVSIGWPRGARGKNVVGQCFGQGSTEDGIAQVFLTPARGADEIVPILGTLVHEVSHATVGVDEGHKGQFIVVQRKLGFLPKWTDSSNQTPELTERLAGLAERLGPFPHGALTLAAQEKQTQKTYMRLIQHEPCGWKIRCTQKQLDLAQDVITCWACGEEAQIEDPK